MKRLNNRVRKVERAIEHAMNPPGPTTIVVDAEGFDYVTIGGKRVPRDEYTPPPAGDRLQGSTIVVRCTGELPRVE